MNTNTFVVAWDFAHQVPWNFKNEILCSEDSITVIRFIWYFFVLVPCTVCSKSARIFSQELGIIDSLTLPVRDRCVVTRARIADFLFQHHNMVNQKLGYTTMKGTWRDSLCSHSNWPSSMYDYLFLLCWNLPDSDTGEETRTVYMIFLKILIPGVIRHTDTGVRYIRWLQIEPLTNEILTKKTLLTNWIYESRKYALKDKITEWDFHDVNTLYNAVRARSYDCRRGEEGNNVLGEEKEGCS